MNAIVMKTRLDPVISFDEPDPISLAICMLG